MISESEHMHNMRRRCEVVSRHAGEAGVSCFTATMGRFQGSGLRAGKSRGHADTIRPHGNNAPSGRVGQYVFVKTLHSAPGARLLTPYELYVPPPAQRSLIIRIHTCYMSSLLPNREHCEGSTLASYSISDLGPRSV